VDLSFLPKQEKRYAEMLRERPHHIDASLEEGRIRDTLEAVWPLPQLNESVLLHGDYWPGNILWNEGQLVAVIDWENAQLGDPLADLANTRLELLWAFGIEAMDTFTRDYASITIVNFTNLPYWDLCAALRHAMKSAEWSTYEFDEEIMRQRYNFFISQAFKKLRAR
jgi:aminoglycoside phosphotransferase (APT) family kinase protein